MTTKRRNNLNGVVALFTVLLMLIMVACTIPTPAGTGGDVAAPTAEAGGTSDDCPPNPVRGTPVPLESVGTPNPDCPPVENSGAEGTPVITGPLTDTAEPGESGTVGDMDIQWIMTPEEVIAQYAIVGGFRMRPSATELPQWTLYGDGTVIWTVEGEPTTGFTNRVMMGKLSESQMRELLTAIGNDGFWELDDRYSDDMVADAANAVITVNLTDQAKQVLVYPAGREDSPAAFNTVMQRLLNEMPADGTEFEPTEFNFTAESLGNLAEMPADAQPSFKEWTVEGVVLADSLGEGQSVTAEQAEMVQAFMNTNGVVVAEEGVAYTIRLEAKPPRPVPAITFG